MASYAQSLHVQLTQSLEGLVPLPWGNGHLTSWHGQPHQLRHELQHHLPHQASA
jgi:hypothetical protein